MNIDFSSIQQLIEAAEAENISISDVVLRQSAIDTKTSEDEVFQRMAASLEVMKASVKDGLASDARSLSGITRNEAYKLKEYVDSGKSLSGNLLGTALYSSMAVMTTNACMGRIVAAPTAGSSGIIPGCFLTIMSNLNIENDALVRGLLNASGIGMVIARNASVSGAVGGCQAECGSASAMTASALVEIRGGTPAQCGHAAALALKSLMGLVCDPVAGLVEEPCVTRNAASSAIAIICADMALAGIASVIPVDEVVVAMGEVGKMLPEALRETALGGIADTPTARRIEKELFGANKS
ncbi:MAG: L-serine ammonia-lyase, iron-sulfur-dependent, subunit alpha [Defluviitaleaceae bacterium]|nr:L-serine ammonia-lyase, iron-sulfur-dependent, subunit alpha [Defluviitaleaceae bacterium]